MRDQVVAQEYPRMLKRYENILEQATSPWDAAFYASTYSEMIELLHTEGKLPSEAVLIRKARLIALQNTDDKWHDLAVEYAKSLKKQPDTQH